MNNDLISREQIRKMLNEAFGCENATKYGNKNAEQQALSYSTLMLYEIANIVEDCCDNAPAVEYPFYQEAYQTGYEEGKNERPQGEFAKMLNERISESVCKYCQMNKHCELCEISRVFQIITLTAEERKGGAKWKGGC